VFRPNGVERYAVVLCDLCHELQKQDSRVQFKNVFRAPEERSRIAQGEVRASGREPWESELATVSAPEGRPISLYQRSNGHRSLGFPRSLS
jgi:hypothetical protein